MTLESSSLELVNCLKEMRECIADLFRLITEDRPYDHSLAHRFEHAAGDVAGRLDAALSAALDLQRDAGRRNHAQTLETLGCCHAEFNLADEKFHTELASFEWRQDLNSLGTEHPEEWLGWATSLMSTLDQCHPTAVHAALLHCWQSLLISTGTLSTRYVKEIDRQLAGVDGEAVWNG